MPARTRLRRSIPDADHTMSVLMLIRQKASFLGEILGSNMDLSHHDDRNELAALAAAIYTAADEWLETVSEGGA